jgi:outer membrane protein assembly factor BamD
VKLKKTFIFSSLIYIILSVFIYGCSSSEGSDIKTDDPEQAFRTAKRKYDDKDYLEAIDDFSLIKVKFPGTSVSDKAQFYLADSYYQREEYILAAYEFEGMLKNYPLSPLLPETRYKLGLCYFNLSPKYSLDQEFTHYAVEELELYIELYPEDKNVRDAEKKLNELKNKLAYKNYRTGILYMKMDDYKAAALYFKSVYEEYVDSEWADDAMLGEAEALINAKKNDEAKRVLERFRRLFPKSTLKSKADNLMRSIG